LLSEQRFAAAAQSSNAAQISGWLPSLKAGVSAERSDNWGVGPAVELELPLFYQGQGQVGAAQAQMRRERDTYADVAVRVRASARTAAARLTAAREAAARYKAVLLPMKQKIVDQTQLQYNAMLVGVFQLLEAKRDQVETAAAYVEQLRDYWLARTEAEQLLAGRLSRGALTAEELVLDVTPLDRGRGGLDQH
jgi:cobalt-zinc-cadmium efflux system outer membrane protein